MRSALTSRVGAAADNGLLLESGVGALPTVNGRSHVAIKHQCVLVALHDLGRDEDGIGAEDGPLAAVGRRLGCHVEILVKGLLG